jgi:hypothetical protein
MTMVTLEEAKKKINDLFRKGVSREDAIAIIKDYDFPQSAEALQYLDWLFAKEKQILGKDLELYRLDGVPPTFEFELNGQRKTPVPVKHSTLMKPEALDNLFLAYWGKIIIGDLPPARWRQQVIKYFEAGQVRDRKLDGADLGSRIAKSLKHWLDQRGEGSEYSDIEAGSYVLTRYKGRECYGFDPRPFLHWLHADIQQPVRAEDVQFHLRQFALKNHQVRVGKSGLRPYLWIIPRKRLDFVGFAPQKASSGAVSTGKKPPPPEEVNSELPDF